MKNAEFQARLVELTEQIQSLPERFRDRLTELVQETEARRERMRAASSELEDAFSCLKLNSQYLAFDLEATRRENEVLKRALEDRD